MNEINTNENLDIITDTLEFDLPSQGNSKKLKFVGWIILLVTLLSIIMLSFYAGIVSFNELSEGEGMPAGIPLSLEYAMALFVATLISLTIIFALTLAFIWKPLKKNLEIRRVNIETNIDAASYTRKVAEANWAESKEAKQKVKEEGKEIISTAKLEADREKKKALDATKREQDSLIEKSRAQIEKEKEQLKDDIRNEILSTSLLAAEKILEKELDQDANNKMINELIESLK